MIPDITRELEFRTARSSGSGGQNVNKVETMVEIRWNIAASELFNAEKKDLLFHKLASKINAEGILIVRSQADRTQLGNKHIALKKLNELIAGALKKKKSRIATKPSFASKEKRIEKKKKQSRIKEERRWKPE